ncbi:MAG: hypothetical protein JST92_26750, partial [Deltaproteobacteria bacterium]|nr:hypothetical protein [Deltaproteobacteria bacterium]
YWVWIPGRIWGPAWVSWRNGGGGMGWCALGWHGEVCRGGPGWIFVEQRHFLDPVRTYGIPPGQTRGWYERSHHLPKLRPGKHWGPPIRFVSKAVGHPVRPVPVTTAGTSMGATRSGTYNGGGVHVFVPRTQPFPHPVNRGPGRYETPREWPAPEHTRTGPPERPGNEWHPPSGEPHEGHPRVDHGGGEWNRGGEAGQGPGGRPRGGDQGEGHPRGGDQGEGHPRTDPGPGRPQGPGGWHAPHESPPQREPREEHGGNTGIVPPHRMGGEGSGGRPERPQGKPEKSEPPPRPKVQIEKK